MSTTRSKNPLIWSARILAALLLIDTLSTAWEWLILMDDYSYNRQFGHHVPFFSTLSQDIATYWHAGRFTPVKSFVNLLKWQILPQSPNAFHLGNLIQLTLLIFAMAWATARTQKIKFKIALAAATTFAILQRPILDTVALNSITEPNVVLFLALGFALWSAKSHWYRIPFVLAALSKEPAITALAATAYLHGVHAFQKKDKRSLAQAAVDTTLVIAQLVVIRSLVVPGSYLEAYSLFSLKNVVPFLISCVKVSFGALPVLAFLDRDALKVNPRTVALIVLTLGGYLFLASARAISGYLLMPVSGCIAMLCAILATRPGFKLTRARTVAFAVLVVFVGGITAVRYQRFTDGINTAGMFFLGRSSSTDGSVVVTEATEAATTAVRVLKEEGISDPCVLPLELTAPAKSLEPALRAHHAKRVEFFEFTNYFNPTAPSRLEEIRQTLGGWSRVEDHGSWRVYHSDRAW